VRKEVERFLSYLEVLLQLPVELCLYLVGRLLVLVGVAMSVLLLVMQEPVLAAAFASALGLEVQQAVQCACLPVAAVLLAATYA
jgi:hypothetical protein